MQKIRDENKKQVKKIEGEGGVDSARVRICREEMKSLMFMEERRKKMKEQEMIEKSIRLEFMRYEYMGNRQSKGCIYRCDRGVSYRL